MKKIEETFEKLRGVKSNIILLMVSVTAVIVLCFISVNLILDKDRQNETELIYRVLDNRIRDDFDKPIYVAKTMAGDTLLADLVKEDCSPVTESFSRKMQTYLEGIRRSAGLERVYYSSARTMNYFSDTGFEKVIEPEKDSYDLWYTRFIESGEDWDLDVAFDQVNSEIWTIFIDKRMEDEDGALLGVCTVGMEISGILDKIREMEEEYGVRIYFVDPEGNIQAQTEKGSDSSSVFTFEIPSESDDGNYQYFTEKGYVIGRYIPSLDLYMVIENNGNSSAQVLSRAIYLVFGLLLVFVVLSQLVNIISAARERGRINSQADLDPMTGLWNRSGTEKMIRSYMGSREGQLEGGALFAIDLDHFREVNETLGHEAGDRLLISTAEFLRSTFGESRMIGRLGGDEFLAFAPGLVDVEKIHEQCRTLNQGYGQNADGEEGMLSVSLSIGVAVYPRNSASYEKLWQAADKALGAAKKAGRDRWEIYELLKTESMHG